MFRPIRVDHTEFFKWLLKLFNSSGNKTNKLPVLWSHQVGHEQRDHVFVISYGHVFMISSWTGSRRNVHFRMLITKWWSGHDLLMNWITDHQLYTVSWWSVRDQVREQDHELVHEQITSKITNMITNGSPARSRTWSRIDHQQDHDLDHEHYHEWGHPGSWTFWSTRNFGTDKKGKKKKPKGHQ